MTSKLVRGNHESSNGTRQNGQQKTAGGDNQNDGSRQSNNKHGNEFDHDENEAVFVDFSSCSCGSPPHHGRREADCYGYPKLSCECVDELCLCVCRRL